MSHSYGNGNSSGNNYLSRKRADEDNQLDNRYHYDRYDKFEKYGAHSRYTNMNYIQSKPPPGSNYYNYGSRYRNNFYNNQKSFHNNGYMNRLDGKRDYKKPFQKYNTSNANEGIRNLSHCEMPSPPQNKQKVEDNSLKSNSSSTEPETHTKSMSSTNNSINIKDLNKLVSNITSRMQPSRNQPYPKHIFQNQQNINIKIHLTSPPNLKFNKEKQINEQESKWQKEEDCHSIKIAKPTQKLSYEPFNRNIVKLDENPMDNFEVYPRNLYEINLNLPKKVTSTTISESINNDNIENALSIKSCYLLAKISNWRLVTNFVPASSLTEEKFSKILPLEEDEEQKDAPKTSKNKSHIVYFGKYEDLVDKYLDMNKSRKEKIKTDIFNIKSIIEQYHYDILKIKNKIKQNIYKTKYLTIKQESLNNAIEENTKE